MKSLRLVVLESPYAGDVDAHVVYARRAIRHCLAKNEAPIASHLLYTQKGILIDGDPEDRALGMQAGHEWMMVCDAVVVYEDYGVSPGMSSGIAAATMIHVPIEYRKIGRNEGGMFP